MTYLPNNFDKAVQKVFHFHESSLIEWFVLFFKYGVITPFTNMQTDDLGSLLLIDMMKSARSQNLSPDLIEKFKKCLAKSVVKLLNEIQEGDSPYYLETVLNCIREFPHFDNEIIDVLIDFSNHEHRYMTNNPFGAFNLQAYLLDTIFKFVIDRKEDHGTFKRVKSLAIKNLEDSRYVHICFNYIYIVDDELACQYLPKVLSVVIQNKSINFDSVIKKFIAAVPKTTLMQNIQHIVDRLHQFSFKVSSPKYPTLWDRFVNAVNVTRRFVIEQPDIFANPSIPNKYDSFILVDCIENEFYEKEPKVIKRIIPVGEAILSDYDSKTNRISFYLPSTHPSIRNIDINDEVLDEVLLDAIQGKFHISYEGG